MELHEVKSLRERRFGLTPKTAIRDASGAREFIHRVGFCFTRTEKELLLPSFLGAVILSSPEPVAKTAVKAASKSKKPTAPRTGEDIILPLLREKSVFEGRLLRDRSTLVSSPFLPYFYALVGEGAGTATTVPDPIQADDGDGAARASEDTIAGSDGDAEPVIENGQNGQNGESGAVAEKKKPAPKKKPAAKKKSAASKKAGGGAAPQTPAAAGAVEAAVHEILAAEGPTGARTLATKFVKSTGLGEEALNDAVKRLESRLRVATIDHTDSEGPVYDTFERFRPDAVREGKKLPRLEAAMRILGRYFETVIAAESSHVAEVFGGIFTPEELPDLLKALEERKEVDPDTRLVKGKTFWVCREAAWGDL